MITYWFNKLADRLLTAAGQAPDKGAEQALRYVAIALRDVTQEGAVRPSTPVDKLEALVVGLRADVTRLTHERDGAITIAAERYQEIEELHAAMGEPNQPTPTVTEALRKERDEWRRRYQETIATNDVLMEQVKLRDAEIERQRGWIAGLDAGLCDASIAKQTAEAIATWMDSELADESVGVDTLISAIRAGAWRKEHP